MDFLKKKVYFLLPVSFILIGCEFTDNLKERFLPGYSFPEKLITETKEVSILCGKRNVQDYLDEGWEIVDSTSKDATCSWKSKRAKRGCNLDKDKGCRIIVPDKLGKEVKYSLVRKSTIRD